MRTIASRYVGCLARLLGSIRTLQAREHMTTHILEVQELRSSPDLDAGLGQAIDQQTLVLVLRKDQRVREGAQSRAHVGEDCACHILASHPEIGGHAFPSTLDDRMGAADLAVK